MYLDRTYKPRRRRKSWVRFWPLYLIAIVGIILYERQPSWMSPQQLEPTPTPTRSAGSYRVAVDAAMRTADFDGALDGLSQIARLTPDDPGPLIEQARIYLMLNQLDEAQALAAQAVEVAPESPEANATLARVFDWQGRFEEAIDLGLDALELDPENVYTLAVLGEVYTDVGNWIVAESYLNDAAALEPENELVLRNRAWLAELQGNYEEAIALYEQAVAVAPHRFDYVIEEARQYEVGLQNYEKAQELYERAATIYRSAQTLDELGYSKYKQGDPYGAIRDLRDAIALDPDYGLAQVHLGMALYQRLDYEQAVEHLERGVELLGDDARVEHIYSAGLAHIYKEPSECERAIPLLLRALEIEPDSPSVLQGLEACE